MTRKIKVEPQPTGTNHPWPTEDSGIEWWEVQDDATWHAIDYIDLEPFEVVQVEQNEVTGYWYWVIDKLEPSNPENLLSPHLFLLERQL